VAIVPVVISGTRHLVPKGSFSWRKVKPVVIKIRILEPMMPFKGEDAEAYRQRVRETMRLEKEGLERL
jgi:1-acyl-sn-glycerol-3-phosphate acyltransferase